MFCVGLVSYTDIYIYMTIYIYDYFHYFIGLPNACLRSILHYKDVFSGGFFFHSNAF